MKSTQSYIRFFILKLSRSTGLRREKIPEHQAKAMKAAPLARRIFITKHATGMCGVGKFMKLWEERDKDACQRCDAPESAPHIWICPQSQATEVWSLSLH
jgi:hypothetical protein